MSTLTISDQVESVQATFERDNAAELFSRWVAEEADSLARGHITETEFLDRCRFHLSNARMQTRRAWELQKREWDEHAEHLGIG